MKFGTDIEHKFITGSSMKTLRALMLFSVTFRADRTVTTHVRISPQNLKTIVILKVLATLNF